MLSVVLKTKKKKEDENNITSYYNPSKEGGGRVGGADPDIGTNYGRYAFLKNDSLDSDGGGSDEDSEPDQIE